MQVFLHSRDICVVNILLVQILDNLRKTSERHQEDIKSSYEISFFRRSLFRRFDCLCRDNRLVDGFEESHLVALWGVIQIIRRSEDSSFESRISITLLK